MFGRRKRQPKPTLIYYNPPERQMPETYEQAFALYRKCQATAARRRNEVRAQIIDQWKRGVRDLNGLQVSVVVDIYLRTDRIWKVAVADEDWYRKMANVLAAGASQYQLSQLYWQGHEANLQRQAARQRIDIAMQRAGE